MDIQDLPKTRKEAKELGTNYYFTGEPCKHGHIAPRKTKGACVECLKAEWKQAASKREEYFREYNQREKDIEAKHAWYQQNKDKVVASAYAQPIHLKRAYQKAWKERNGVWTRADTKARRRKHREATPPWLSRKQKSEIRQLYQIAITMSQTTGEQYVVDHIYPLRSETVCGLHVPWNLRVVTQKENLVKSNAIPDDSMALAFPPNN